MRLVGYRDRGARWIGSVRAGRVRPWAADAASAPAEPLPGPSWTGRWTAVALHAFRVGRRVRAARGSAPGG